MRLPIFLALENVFCMKIANLQKSSDGFLGYAWAEDKEHCEEYGRMLQADPAKVSYKAKKRGLPQVCIAIVIREILCLCCRYRLGKTLPSTKCNVLLLVACVQNTCILLHFTKQILKNLINHIP